MTKPNLTILPDRGLIAVAGDDARSFLQGIVSNDMEKVSQEKAGYGAFLTPQGKYLFDFFMVEHAGRILIETEVSRIPDFIKRLSLYKLRANVALNDVSGDYLVAAAFGPDSLAALSLPSEPGSCIITGACIAFTDPRLSDAGARLIISSDNSDDILSNPIFQHASLETYDIHRINLGLPDSSRDMVVEKSVLLENGFDELNGVDWHKGCYMGQEVTARTKHRGLLKKRLLPVTIDGAPPAAGTPIMAGDREAGEMRSSCGNAGMALIRLDYLDESVTPESPLRAGEATIMPKKPEWMTL